MAYVMILAGAGMVVGNLVGGYLSDRLSPEKTCVLLLFLMMSSLVGVFFPFRISNYIVSSTFILRRTVDVGCCTY
jgi:DHA1 family arabinose polymer transporter-like MFS transporter